MDKNKIKVFFVLPTLYAGGAERVITFVSKNLNKTKFDITLIVIGFEKDNKYDTSDLSVIYLNKTRVLSGATGIIKLLAKCKPQIVVSSITHLNIMMGLISKFFPKIKFIGRHATITNIASKYKKQKKKSLISYLINTEQIGIKNLDYIICQSTDMKDDFLQIYNINENKIKIIHNPVTQISVLKKDSKKVNHVKKFITVGRMVKIKGQARLLNILSRLTIPFEFTIIGTGSNKEDILNKINDLNLTDKVNHIEYSDDVFSHLIKHDMFLQGSYSEGFPNALLESCTVGLPVIAFNAPGGTKEIVTNGINGYIVENENEFLKKLQEEKVWNPKKISEHVNKKFNKDKIIRDYEQLFLDLLN
ncbi:glycosyltransferase [Winogradskyella psychrotolerans]|uniref:glycosyltransferase n=1 Tax=Winogradskyella psychrotolerans TaxID=1344585 RepID=UPI001C072B29|nr:glycosyltransferase [Winogradskyella psychrotolerans]MBU2930122.1 glycosyltransferase [Winogradskyella psychrotolerans]